MPNEDDDKLETKCFLLTEILLRLCASEDIELSKSKAIISREGGIDIFF